MTLTNKPNAIAILYPEGANVRIPFYVEFHSGYSHKDLDGIVREMFFDISNGAYGELL